MFKCITALVTCCVLSAASSIAQQSLHAAKVRSVEVQWPNLLVRGSNLSKVELWAGATGTELPPVLLGRAKRRNSAGEDETWVLPIPSESMTVAEIYAEGFDKRGRSIGAKNLPLVSATELQDLGKDDK